jgi:acyl-[acyl-carrier-protein]-phospholipid O-acyltransferase/long-chain-fatty-acid--[acyl-carrier-protein] ligase
MDVAAAPTDGPQQTAGRGLLSPSFLGLLVTQFLTAVNDNIFRWLVIGIGKDHVEAALKSGDAPSWLSASNVLMGGTACFVLPYLFLAAPAGYLADRFRKKHVIVACKVGEIVIMVFGYLAILQGNLSPVTALSLLFAILTLMGAQAALFAPSRSGSIPETLRPERLSLANGLFGLMTVMATVVGMVAGSWLADKTGNKGMDAPWMSGSVLIGVAIAGTLTSLLIVSLPAGNPSRKFPWDFPIQTWRDLRTLASDRAMLRVALGILFFYSIGSLAQLNIDQLAQEAHGLTQANETDKIPLLVSLILGVCIGSVLAGLCSGDHVELGLVPLGALGIAIAAGLLFTVPATLFDPAVKESSGLVWACFLLVMLGISAGLFSVPLEAAMQHWSPRESRGSILAANNFMIFTGILLSSLLYAGLRMPVFHDAAGHPAPLLNAQQIFLLAGLATIPVFIYIVVIIPQATIRFLVILLSLSFYRIRVYGKENLPAQGGALLVPNHITWIDAFFLLRASSRPIRMVALSSNLENRWVAWLGKMFGAILINPTKPKMVIMAFREAREALNNGELVCIFPEGGMTRSGQVQAFKPGTMKILDGANAPVVPVYLDGLWGSVFSFEGAKFFWKWPKRFPYPMTIHFGPPIEHPEDVHQLRQAVLEQGAAAVDKSAHENMDLLTRLFIRQCKSRKRLPKIADSTGAELTGGDVLLRSLILRRILRRNTLAKDEQYVGVLVPPSVPGFLVNMALALDKRVSVNLNYTVSSDVMNACIEMAGIKHVITSRKFMEKMDFKLNAEIVYLEDFKDKATAMDKAVGYTQAHFWPARLLEASLGLGSVKPDDILTIIFTSGSTGTPKGVMLTYANIGSNVEAINQVLHLRKTDCLVGILPFFHSFGYTVALWGVGTLDISGAYHYSPLDARQIAKLISKYKGTLFLSTPTFLRSYLRRCDKEDLASLEVVVCGAEKLPMDLAKTFEEKFGVRPVEGYGTTELSPVASVNVPPSRSIDNFQKDSLEGSVGRPLPGIIAKTTNLDTGAECKVKEPGMLWIKGPNVMKGYLHQPELTAEVIKDGWYKTGDVAFIDEEGFIHITGRESRFSKIGGEMVPHIKVEDELSKLAGCGEEGGPQLAVTSVADEKKGERLIVIHTKMAKTPDELRKGLTEAGLPNLFIPGSDSFLEVPSLPVLGTGKVDLRGLKELAKQQFPVG